MAERTKASAKIRNNLAKITNYLAKITNYLAKITITLETSAKITNN